MSTPDMLSVALVGNVDHGKSTLLGRLMYDLGAIPPSRVESLKASSSKRGVDLEWSFLLDSFQAERDQAVTIDVTHARVSFDGRTFRFIDAPGHVEFLRNMIGGAAQADAAVLLVDATQGAREQTLRHAALLKLLGVRDVVVVVNKIDLCSDAQDAFSDRAATIASQLAPLGLVLHACIPVDARRGANLLARDPAMAWYAGPALMPALAAIDPGGDASRSALRLPLQDVYRIDDVRWFVGRVEAGTLHPGDELIVSPGGRRARVRTLVPDRASPAGTNVAIAFDDDVFAVRGDVLSHVERAPRLTRVFDAEVFWLNEQPLVAGRVLRMRVAAREAEVVVQRVQWRLAADGVERLPTDAIERFAIGCATFRSASPLPLDDHATSPALGRAVLKLGHEAVGIATLDASAYPDLRQHAPAPRRDVVHAPHMLDDRSRQSRYGHAGAVVWMTGLSGAGKSTLAMALERDLMQAGYAAYVLDGDNLRHGLNADLGFGPDDRRENVRRAGEVAALFADAGLVCIVALISPYRDDRELARVAARAHPFFEVFVDSPLAVCETRDPKGLYRRARSKEIRGFTGIDAPYEAPPAPDLVVDTASRTVADSSATLLAFVEARLPPSVSA